MKNLKIYLVAMLLSFGISASATTSTSEKDHKDVTTQIAELLKNPGINVEKEVMAKVTFIVNSDNELVVINVDTKDRNVDAFIKSRLNYQKIDINVKGEWVVPVRITTEA